MSRTTIDNVNFYIGLINAKSSIKIYLRIENGTNYIAKKRGNEAIFNGSLNECYSFLVGSEKIINPAFNDYTVNGNFRVFQVVDSRGDNFFCNITDLNKVVSNNGLKSGYFTIYYFDNNKPKKVSKKVLKSFFEGAQLDQNFEY